MNTITHSIKTPSLTEFDLAPYTGKAIQYICLDEQDLSKLSNQGFIHTTHSPIIKLEQTTLLLLYVRMFHQTKKTAATVHAIAATKNTLYLGIIVPPSTAPLCPAPEEKIRTHLKTTTPARPSGSKKQLMNLATRPATA